MEDRAYGMMNKILQNDPTLTFSNVEEKMLVNGYAPKYIDIKGTAGFTLSGLMEDYGISSITFKQGMKREELSVRAKEQNREKFILGVTLHRARIILLMMAVWPR